MPPCPISDAPIAEYASQPQTCSGTSAVPASAPGSKIRLAPASTGMLTSASHAWMVSTNTPCSRRNRMLPIAQNSAASKVSTSPSRSSTMCGSNTSTPTPAKLSSIPVMRTQRMRSRKKITARIRLNGTPACPAIASAETLVAAAKPSAAVPMNNAPAISPVPSTATMRPGSQRSHGRHTASTMQ